MALTRLKRKTDPEAEDYRKAARWWAASGAFSGPTKRHIFGTRREAFLSGLGMGAMVGAAGMLLVILWLSG